MRLNNNTKIIGDRVILIPYEANHVPKYHQWMKSQELQHLTASEPLSLDEEYSMQRSWREDDDKCTFIVLQKSIYESMQNEIDAMIGDTNIFITDKENNRGEIEIMLAEKSARGQKLGWESVIMMLLYGINYINIQTYEAKILMDNTISIQMFEKLGFCKISESKIFNEITLEKTVNHEWIQWLEKLCSFNIECYR